MPELSIGLIDYGYIWIECLKYQDPRFLDFLKKHGMKSRYELRLIIDVENKD